MIIYRLPASRNKVMSKRSCTFRESNISVRKFRNITRCKCNRFGVLFGNLSSKLIQYVTFTYKLLVAECRPIIRTGTDPHDMI